MASQTGTMSPFYSDEHLEPSHLLRKVILLFLLVIALALGLDILFRAKSGFSPMLQKLFSDLCMAVVAGFGSRLIIRNQPGFVRGVAAMASYVIGLLLLGFLSKWKYGMGPIVFWSRDVNWDGLAQFGLGLVLFLLVFRAWSKADSVALDSAVRSPKRAPNIFVRNKKARARASQSSNARIGFSKLSMPSFSWPRFGTPAKRPTGNSRSKAGSKARVNYRSKDQPPTLSLSRPSSGKQRNLFRKRPHVQLALVEDHRCPYCLEEVQRTDPRGVVECEVCHALHHKDCWEITGTCQVPHLNT
jgi:hypothetical protein